MARPRSRPGRRGALAERLREARRARKLTQAQAATEIRVTRPTLALWETGGARPIGPALRFVEIWTQAALGEQIELPGMNEPETGGTE